MRDSIDGARSWWSDADLPDPLLWADVRRRPDLVAAAVRDRCQRDWTFGAPRTFAYPKPTGGHRDMMRLDPIADLAYRQVVGRIVGTIDDRLPDTVFSSRSQPFHSSWKSRAWRKQRRAYHDAVEEARVPFFAGEVHLDTADHYRTVALEPQCHLMLSLGAAPVAVDRLMSSLTGLHCVPGMGVGLPIGPEASAPLGTVHLLPLDRRLAGLGFIANRWMDDVVVPVPDAAVAETVLEAAAYQLGLSGQGSTTE